MEEAVDKAVRECIEADYLKDVLSEERAAVMLEMLTTFDEKEYEEGLREEGREEGRDIHLIEQVQKKVNKGKTLEEIAEDLEEEPEGIRKIYDLVVSMAGATPEMILHKL